MVALQVSGLLTLCVFALAAYITIAKYITITFSDELTWAIWLAADAALMLGVLAWLTLAWFLAIRTSDSIEWVLDCGGVLSVLDHNPAEYGVPMGLESYAKLIVERNHEVLLQGVLSTGWLIIHEFGQPLGLLKDLVGSTDLLSADQIRARLKSAERQVQQLNAYVDALGSFRDGQAPNERVEIVEIVRIIAAAQSATYAHRLETSQLDSGQCLEVLGLKPLLVAAISNVVKNGLLHTIGKVFVSINETSISNTGETEPRRRFVAIRIEDEGAHLLEEQVQGLFRSPLRRIRGKHGLGLPLSRVYCLLHGGDLQYDPKGSRKAFVITLPLA